MTTIQQTSELLIVANESVRLVDQKTTMLRVDGAKDGAWAHIRCCNRTRDKQCKRFEQTAFTAALIGTFDTKPRRCFRNLKAICECDPQHDRNEGVLVQNDEAVDEIAQVVEQGARFDRLWVGSGSWRSK